MAGGVDRVIYSCAGRQFHQQVAKQMPIKDGQTIVTKGDGSSKGAFKDVVFVIDDLRRPLSEVVLAGLKATDVAGFKNVTMPAIRMGLMLGAVEKTAKETIAQMVIGIKAFVASAVNVESITVVVYNDPDTEEMLKKQLS